MTTIISYHGDQPFMCADSLTSYGSNAIMGAEPKLQGIKDGIIIGLSGCPALKPIVRRFENVLKQVSTTSMDYSLNLLNNDFLPDFQKALRESPFLPKDDVEDLNHGVCPMQILIATRQRSYCLVGDFSFTVSEDFAAIGSGRNYALAAYNTLLYTKQPIDPNVIMNVVECLDLSTRRPFPMRRL